MPYRFLGEIATADVAFEATGATVEELFISAAEAAMNVMVHDLEDIGKQTEIPLRLENHALDMLLFNLLQELIFYKDAKNLLLRVEEIKVTTGDEGFSLAASCWGEEIDVARHKLIVDVKAVTLHMFSVEETADGWKATVILDI